jgi:hypothetical protein
MIISHLICGGIGKVLHQPDCLGNGSGFGTGANSIILGVYGKGISCGKFSSGSGGASRPGMGCGVGGGQMDTLDGYTSCEPRALKFRIIEVDIEKAHI